MTNLIQTEKNQVGLLFKFTNSEGFIYEVSRVTEKSIFYIRNDKANNSEWRNSQKHFAEMVKKNYIVFI